VAYQKAAQKSFKNCSKFKGAMDAMGATTSR
jgi:hypothetical protein